MPKVTIISNHTHNGVSYNSGAECEMTAEEAQSYAKLVVNMRSAVPVPAAKLMEGKIVVEEKEEPRSNLSGLFGRDK
jgi:hypothetical protein